MRVLLTGAAGRIGSAFVAETAGRYRSRLADRDISALAGNEGKEVVRLDVADLDACRSACAGMDAVVHLAADPSPEAEFYPSLLENNIKGVYNIYRAATDAGCHRVVYASSAHAVAGYPPGRPIGADVPVRPVTLYGATKCFGEAVGAYFAEAEGLSTIAIRIGAYDAPWIHADPTPASLSAYVSPRDLNQLIVRALEAPPEVRFAVVNGQSNNRISRLDLTSARDLLGYEPQDDAFALFSVAP
jgi:nucleoside-diphosphate-sugar epimerase